MAAQQDYARDEQDLWLSQASKNVKKCAFYMKKAIDEDNMQEALRHSAALLGELRTSLLGPQKYYELYMQANDDLRSLEAYFSEEPSKGRSFADLYELVQHAGNVLPRLYLLCTVGACYIRSKEAPAKAVLQDMADMCKGVQHPTRGLFLRAYLVQQCRGLLPDTGSGYEGGEGGDVVDAIEFLLSNFTEMNKLWVRMKRQGNNTREKEQRERERAQLADLVGKNLTQLSQLEGLSFELYRDVVLPRVLEQVVACRDDLAQGYLMQCIAAAFPDDYHVGTLEALLGALPQLQPGVKLATVMGSLLERLASYAAREPSVVQELDAVGAFPKMSDAVAKSVEEHTDMPPGDLAAMYAGLLAFAGAVYPDRLDFVDDVLATCHAALAPRGAVTDARAERQVVALLSSPLERYGVATVLGLEHYAPVTALLTPGRRRDVARRVGEAVVRSSDVGSSTTVGGPSTKKPVGDAAAVDTLLIFLKPLIEEEEGLNLDDEDISDDAALLAKVFGSLRSENADEQFAILEALLGKALIGGPIRIAAVIPPICFSALQIARKVFYGLTKAEGAAFDSSANKNNAVLLERWYRFLHRAASALADARAAEIALQLFLAAALSASQEARLEMVAYECMEQAFTLFEESIPDSKQEVRALQSIVGTLHRCRVFGQDNRAALVHKATAYCSKLLRRADQCLAVLGCAHLYWQEAAEEVVGAEEKKEGAGSAEKTKEKEEEEGEEEDDAGPLKSLRPPVRDSKGVLSCLKRALKIAHAAQQQLAVASRRGDAASSPGHLFLEILNVYLFFFDRGVDAVTPEVVRSVMELAASELSTQACLEDEGLQVFWKRTQERVKAGKESEGESGARYATL